MVNSLYPKLRPQALAGVGGLMIGSLLAKAEHEYFRHDILVEAEAEAGFESRAALPGIDVPVFMVNGSEGDYFPMNLIAETAI